MALINLTRQEMFNIAYLGLLAQNKKSEIKCDRFSSCCYRLFQFNEPTLKCAIGMIIPDELYDPLFEDYPVSGLVEGYEEEDLVHLADLFKLEDHDFLSELQLIHDRFNVEEWQEELIKLANKYELTVPEQE